MADNIGSLYVRLGLNLSELETGFVTAEQTVRQGIATLNRQQNIVKLKMEADTAGLDAIADKSKILAIQEQALTQVLEMQRDKLKLATAAYQDLANSKNANSAAVQNSQAAMERERLAVARLEAQLKSLSGQKLFIDTTQLQESIAKINARIQHIRITAEIDTSKLKSAGSVFDEQKAHVNALTKELELQRQKLIQLREAMYQSAKSTGGGSVQTLNIKSNVLQQIQEINRLETKLKEIQNTNINLQIRADSIKKAEADIQENISRINAKIEHIRVKTDIDVSKLGAVATEFDRAKAHVQGLNQELTLQNQKLAEMRKALSTSISANGLNNVKTINLSTEIQKQIQTIDQLKAKINELNKIQPPQTNNLLSGYLNIKGDVVGKLNEITSAFSQLKGATSSADNAITSALGIIGTIPHPVGRAVAALASLPLIFKGIENSIVDMTRAAAASGDAVYVMSRGMQMSLKDAGKFSTNAKVAGTEVNSLKMAIQQVQRQIVKGGGDSRAAEWLKRYGESARDANGNLKNLNDMTFSLSRALHKAQEEGKGAEFVFSVFRNISADDITAIEDWIAVNEQASKIVKNGLANPALAHEVKGNLNTLAIQEGHLKASFESALLPVANEIIPRITERMGKLTQVIVDNKDVIKELGNDLASIWGGIETVVDKIGDGVGVIGGVIKDVYMARANAENRLVERYKNDTNVKTAEDLLQRELPRGYTPQDRAAIEATPYLYEQELKKYEPVIKAIQNAREEIKEEKKALSDEIASVAGISSATADRRAVEEDPELLKQAESLKKILQETSEIQYKLSHTDYENKKLDILQWQQDMLNQAEITEEKRAAIEKLGAAKLAQIEQERADKLAEIRASVEAAEQTEFEKRISAIEKEKEEWIKIGMEKAEAEKLAEQQKADYIKNIEQELSNNINSLQQSDLEKQLARIEKEKQAWISKGASEAQAEQLAQAQREQAYQNQEKMLNEIRDSVMALDRTELENKLANIEKERQAWIQKGMDELEATELAQRKSSKAYEESLEQDRSTAEKHSKAVAQAYQDAAKKRQAAEEEAIRKNKALRDEALNVLRQEAKEFETFLKEGYSGLQKLMQDKLIKSGVNPDLLKQMTPEKLEAYKSAREDAQRSFLPNWKEPYSAEPVKVNLPENLDKTSQAANTAAKSLDVLAKSALNAAGRSEQDFSANPENVSTGRQTLRVYTKPDGSTEITNMAEVTPIANDFSVVAKEAEQSLKDFGAQAQRSVEQINASQYENPGSMPTDAYKPVLSETPAEITSILNLFGELSTVIQGVSANLSQMAAPEYAATGSPISYIEPELQSFIQTFSIMGAGVGEVTIKINELSAALESLLRQQINTPSTEARQPVAVNTTVSIEEAHAWDYNHIQELADKVADIIKPEIISAIGGDSNSY